MHLNRNGLFGSLFAKNIAGDVRVAQKGQFLLQPQSKLGLHRGIGIAQSAGFIGYTRQHNVSALPFDESHVFI